MDNHGHRLPPYSEEAERGVLGALLMDCERVMEICGLNVVTEDSFYVPSHRLLFKQLIYMTSMAIVVDLLTVYQHLKDNDDLDACGGYAFLEGLVDSTPTAAHAEYYAGFVRQKELLRNVITEAGSTIEKCFDAGEEDAESIILSAQNGFFELGTQSESKDVRTTGEVALDVVERWKGIVAGTETFGLEPFLPEIKQIIGNYVPGNPYYIGAEPGGGKSVILQNQAVFTALSGVPVAVWSGEMTKEKLISRVLAQLGDLSAWAMDNREYGDSGHAVMQLEKALKAAKSIENLPLYIEDRPMDVDELCGWALRMRSKHKIGFIGFDYLQLLSPPARLGLKGMEALAYVCNKLQQLFKNDNVIKMVLSQITKLPRNDKTGAVLRKPRQDDFYGGRIIDANSEGSIFVWNDGENTKILVDKNRNGGTGERSVGFIKNRNRFESLVVQREESDEPAGLL